MLKPKGWLEWAAVVAALVGAFGLGVLTGVKGTMPLFVMSQKGAYKLYQRAIAAEHEAARSDSARGAVDHTDGQPQTDGQR